MLCEQKDGLCHEVLRIEAVEWIGNSFNQRLSHFALLLSVSEGQARGGIREFDTGHGPQGMAESNAIRGGGMGGRNEKTVGKPEIHGRKQRGFPAECFRAELEGTSLGKQPQLASYVKGKR